MAILREVLTVRDVALELRCSVAHVYNVINGRVKNVPRLPTIAIGRRKLIQRHTLEEWKRSNEHGYDDLPTTWIYQRTRNERRRSLVSTTSCRRSIGVNFLMRKRSLSQSLRKPTSLNV